jgi:hypothetical protein
MSVFVYVFHASHFVVQCVLGLQCVIGLLPLLFAGLFCLFGGLSQSIFFKAKLGTEPQDNHQSNGAMHVIITYQSTTTHGT